MCMVCVYGLCAHVCGVHSTRVPWVQRTPLSVLLYHSLCPWDRVSRWTWARLGASSKPWGSSHLHSASVRVTGMVSYAYFFLSTGNWIRSSRLHSNCTYPRSHLPNSSKYDCFTVHGNLIDYDCNRTNLHLWFLLYVLFLLQNIQR